MRGRLAALLATFALGCAACEVLVGITDRTAGKTDAEPGLDATTNHGDAGAAEDTGSSPADAANDGVVDPVESGATPSCTKGGCNSVDGGCSAAGTCNCTSDRDCPGTRCTVVSGKNDVACGSACTGSGATDGFGCQLAPCVATHFGYTPSNFTPTAHAPPTMPTTDCNGTYSSTAHAFTAGGCSGQSPVVVQNVAQTGGGHVVDLLVFQNLTIASTSTLNLFGANPIILAVYGDATIAGTIDASASGSSPGAGGNTCPVSSTGADAGTGAWEPGGGGGGQSSAGGNGGPSMNTAGQRAGNAQGSGPVPLTGGCAGGMPFVGSLGFAPSAGAGGGGLQLSVAGALDFSAGTLRANGSNGANGEAGRCSAAIAQNGTGGAGAGSGGTVLVEAATVISGTASAKGGTGGAGGPAPAPNGQEGGAGGAGGAAAAGGATGGAGVQNGSAPTGCTWGGYWSGGGGGGGGGGYVKTNLGSMACLCGADSDCASGLCSNVAGQCTGTCSGTTTAGTYDAIDCQILLTSGR